MMMMLNKQALTTYSVTVSAEPSKSSGHTLFTIMAPAKNNKQDKEPRNPHRPSCGSRYRATPDSVNSRHSG